MSDETPMSATPHQITAGLPDSAFVTDGLLTKRPLRAYALAMLEPQGDELLWDLGAGTGSISVEWCRIHPGNRAIAVERFEERASRITANAAALGADHRIEVRLGDVAETIGSLPRPDAVFIGGGLTGDILDHCVAALAPGGRLVAHSVTLESDVVLADAHRTHGGDLTRVGVETAAPLGRLTGFVPGRSVTCFAWTKPEASAK